MAKTKGSRRGNKGGAIKIDLSKVETSTTVAEGNYIVEVESVETKFSENSGSNYLSFTLVIQEGKFKGQKLFHNCSLQPQALFNLKGVLVALGFDIPDEEFELDTEALVGLQCGVEVSHEVYEGKKKARITDFISLDDVDEDEDSEDSDDEDDDSDDESEVDLESLDMDELKQLAKALKITAKAMKKAKTEEDLIELIEEEDEEDIAEKYEELFGEDDSEDEEEDEDEDETDYEDMSLKDLKAEAKDRGLKVKKGMSKEDIIEMLEEDDEE